MIKINLIVTKRKKKAKPIPMFLVAGAGLLVLSLAGSFYAASLVQNKIETLKRQKVENEKEMERLKSKMDEVKKFEKLNKIVQQHAEVIKTLTENQGMPVIVLQEVSETLTDGIWITRMTIDKGNVKIAGVGFSNPDIVSYIQKLKASDVFTMVQLHGTRRSPGKAGATETYSFDVSFKVKM